MKGIDEQDRGLKSKSQDRILNWGKCTPKKYFITVESEALFTTFGLILNNVTPILFKMRQI